ncbi:hypothetical protein EIN_152730 [Entamoeba invadens IP1]|uniref:Uncharacterized protein n=1 Tax=Entamoeba invadens IP1 TaxID=370355 RepID=A0A0A1UEL7_ENTIV|nr:hypothetical protein EIN_152730 [Entamoeba invadens IP1]ELP91276.1 hypothetical protein EIN_152730 [Entamoeba invadens IP1]|eukprot:XP_004258047.1 hypothetical protein EIN_152730 [Entamoeba invadens IP1]
MSGKKLPYIEFKNYQVCQQATFLALLTQYADVTISVRGKKTEKQILAFLQIGNVRLGDGTCFDCSSIVTQKCEELKMSEVHEGLSEQTAVRRYHKNRIVETLHLLIDTLFLLGVDFNTYTTDGKNGVVRAETVREIIFENVVVKTDEVTEIGKLVYNNITQRLKTQNEITLFHGDREMERIVHHIAAHSNAVCN